MRVDAKKGVFKIMILFPTFSLSNHLNLVLGFADLVLNK